MEPDGRHMGTCPAMRPYQSPVRVAAVPYLMKVLALAAQAEREKRLCENPDCDSHKRTT